MIGVHKIIAAALVTSLSYGAALAKSDIVLETQLAAEALKTAAANLSNTLNAQDRVNALTETVRAYESGLSAMRDGLRGATIR